MDPLRVGGLLETGETEIKEVQIADIGRVTVHPNSRLKLVVSKAEAEHRLALDRGRIEVFITAPPRLFFVDTPSAVAVDLGCAYQLEVDESGDGFLDVTLGSVALERGDGYSVTVPAGAKCRLYAKRGPGLPWYGDADEPFRDAIDAFESATGRAAAVDKMIEQSRTLVAALEEAGKPYRYIEQPNGDHFLSLQSHRVEFLEALDEFLAEHLRN